MARPRHSNKHIERAIQYAEALNRRVEISNGHAWGHLLCPHSTRVGCIVSVWSTPRNPENHARQIRREIDLCPHGEDDDGKQPKDESDESKED